MAIYIRCRCKRFVPYKRSECICGERFNGGKQRYSVEYWQSGKRTVKSLGICTRTQAEDAERRLRVAVSEGRSVDKLNNKPLLSEVLNAYRDGLSDRWQKTVKLFFERMTEAWGGVYAHEITEQMANEFHCIIGKSISKSTADRHTACAKAAYNQAGIEPNPFKRVKLFRPDNRLTRYLAPSEESRVLEEARKTPHLFVAIVLAITTGLRKDNVLQLRRDQVDFQRRLIVVRQKGDRTHAIPLNSTAHDLLANLPDNGTPYFLVNPTTNAPYGDIKRSFATCLKNAGVKKKFRWHDLRHHFASKLVTATGSLKAAQEALGHSDFSQTLRYSHFLPGYMRDALESVSINTHSFTHTDATEQDQEPTNF